MLFAKPSRKKNCSNNIAHLIDPLLPSIAAVGLAFSMACGVWSYRIAEIVNDPGAMNDSESEAEFFNNRTCQRQQDANNIASLLENKNRGGNHVGKENFKAYRRHYVIGDIKE